MANALLTEALRLAAMGFAIFPCRPGEKRPATKHGLHEASRDPDQIRAWWKQWPQANVAIVANGLCIIDIDPDAGDWPGPERAATIKQLAPAAQRTPRGGYHVVFRCPPGVSWRPSASKLAPGVDVRCGNSYIVVAPSTVNGKSYVWLRPLRPASELPLPPEWLCQQLDTLARPGPHRLGDPCDDMPVLTEGQRNVGLFRLGCRLRRLGASDAEVESTLLVFNESRCCPALPEAEVRRIAKSIGRYPCGPTTSPYDVLNNIHPLMRSAWKHAIAHRQRSLRHG